MVRFSICALSALVTATVHGLNLTVGSGGGNTTSPLQYGVMFEDINHSGDGGIYAELIQNRAFQGSPVFPSNLSAWSPVNGASLSLKTLSEPLSSALPTSMNVATGGSTGKVGFTNSGWWGIDVKVQPYNGSFWVKGAYNGSFTVSLVSNLTNETFGSLTVGHGSTANQWTQYNYTLTPTVAAPNSNNSFELTFDAAGASDGSLDFNLISLFPPTYKNRPNGMRIDLMEALAGLNPSFLRLPGGNNLEGNDPPYRWIWNQTIGPLTDRPGRPGTWGYENTDGLGLIEYMWWCQDLGMEPILAVWSGLYLDGTLISNDSLEAYVQDSLNELEFLMGSTSTTYGALRAQLGYPDPFPINYVEVGNEDNLNNGSATYSAYRFPDFYYAINSAYPNITVIASTVQVDPWPAAGAAGDYHQYTRPDQFVSQFNFFDNFTSEHPTLIGEYANIQPNIPAGGGANFSVPRSPWPFWIGSVAEAVFLLGAERNADKIIGASYAPTLQNLNSYEWAPDLISFTADPAQDVLSTSWHMISLLSGTRIAETLPVVRGEVFGPAYYVAGVGGSGERILKTAVYNSSGDVGVGVAFEGVGQGATASLTVLTAPDPYSYNSVGSDVVSSSNTTITAGAGGVFRFSLPDLSVSVLVVEGGDVTNSTGTGYGSGRDGKGYWSGKAEWLEGSWWAKGGKGRKVIPRGYREVHLE